MSGLPGADDMTEPVQLNPQHFLQRNRIAENSKPLRAPWANRIIGLQFRRSHEKG